MPARSLADHWARLRGGTYRNSRGAGRNLAFLFPRARLAVAAALGVALVCSLLFACSDSPERLMKQATAARDAGATALTALQSAFVMGCVSPDVLGVGL
jgi:hypothetical protein